MKIRLVLLLLFVSVSSSALGGDTAARIIPSMIKAFDAAVRTVPECRWASPTTVTEPRAWTGALRTKVRIDRKENEVEFDDGVRRHFINFRNFTYSCVIYASNLGGHWGYPEMDCSEGHQEDVCAERVRMMSTEIKKTLRDLDPDSPEHNAQYNALICAGALASAFLSSLPAAE